MSPAVLILQRTIGGTLLKLDTSSNSCEEPQSYRILTSHRMDVKFSSSHAVLASRVLQSQEGELVVAED